VTVLVSPAVRDMSGVAALPRNNGELVFEAPWQGRVLGLTIGLVESLGLPWSAFQSRLIAAIAADPDRPYYESWVAALEALVEEQAIASIT
jgi:nitrile hydratase accessory protein